jgi:hypothetical protein
VTFELRGDGAPRAADAPRVHYLRAAWAVGGVPALATLSARASAGAPFVLVDALDLAALPLSTLCDAGRGVALSLLVAAAGAPPRTVPAAALLLRLEGRHPHPLNQSAQFRGAHAVTAMELLRAGDGEGGGAPAPPPPPPPPAAGALSSSGPAA